MVQMCSARFNVPSPCLASCGPPLPVANQSNFVRSRFAIVLLAATCSVCPTELNKHARNVDNTGVWNMQTCFGIATNRTQVRLRFEWWHRGTVGLTSCLWLPAAVSGLAVQRLPPQLRPVQVRLSARFAK